MRLASTIICCSMLAAIPAFADPSPQGKSDNSQIDVTADHSLEWYQDQHLYVARGNAHATRGTMTVDADVLTAHQREEDENAPPKPKTKTAQSGGGDMNGGGIDRLTAEGNVHITDPRQQIFGDRAVYDFDRKAMKVTGKNLKYMTSSDVVTARDSMEYYDDPGVAIARGKAVDVHDDRHIEGDVLTAYFATSADSKKGKTDAGNDGAKELSKVTAEGHVVVITATDVSRGDHGVYDVKNDTAVITGHARITREGTQLSGDSVEMNFATGESRLINQGSGRVHALLTPKPDGKKKAAQ